MPTIGFTPAGADGPLASLEVGAKYDTTYFPSDLSEAPYFIVFRATKRYKASQLADTKVNYTSKETEFGTVMGDVDEDGIFNKIRAGVKVVGNFAKKLEGLGIDISQPAHSFALPIPANLGTAYNAQYNNAELGVAGEAARKVGSKFERSSGSFISDIVDAVNKTDVLSADNLKGSLTSLAVSAAGADTAAAGLAGAAFGGLGGAAIGAGLGSFGQGALRGLGIANNPHLANVFTGVNFRVHTFQYKLIAKNKQESDTIRDMIRNFKYHMAPDYSSSDHIFNYPSQFQIILRAGDYLFNIGDSVLTSFDVNYTGEGGPYFFEDTNAPYSVAINLSFTEDTIVTKREIRQGR